MFCDKIITTYEYALQVKAAQNIVEILENGPDAKRTDALRSLSDLSEDIKFATNFVNKKGVPILIKLIQAGSWYEWLHDNYIVVT